MHVNCHNFFLDPGATSELLASIGVFLFFLSRGRLLAVRLVPRLSDGRHLFYISGAAEDFLLKGVLKTLLCDTQRGAQDLLYRNVTTYLYRRRSYELDSYVRTRTPKEPPHARKRLSFPSLFRGRKPNQVEVKSPKVRSGDFQAGLSPARLRM